MSAEKIGGVRMANCLHMGSIHKKLGRGDGWGFEESGGRGGTEGVETHRVGEGVEEAMW